MDWHARKVLAWPISNTLEIDAAANIASTGGAALTYSCFVTQASPSNFNATIDP